jgi:hypothetical protein
MTEKVSGRLPLPLLFVVFVVAVFLSTLASSAAATWQRVGHDRSDAFWSLVTPRGMAAEEYLAPAVMAASADLVVVGRVVSVERGREWVANPDLVNHPDPAAREGAFARFATVMVQVESTLGPSAFEAARALVPVEVFLVRPEVLGELKTLASTERAIFVLRNKGPDDSVDFFRLVNDTQGLVREFDGKAHVMSGEVASFARLEGLPFTRVVEEFRAARGG